jgi:hypothetical protein
VAQTNRYAGVSKDPQSLSAKNHLDIAITDLDNLFTFDPVTNLDYALYYRIDKEAAAGGETIALLKPGGKLIANQSIDVNVGPSEGYYIHFLLCDSAGAAQNGGAEDRLLHQPFGANP